MDDQVLRRQGVKEVNKKVYLIINSSLQTK